MRPLDPRVADGMREQLALRDARTRRGERPLGWKVGFGSPAAFERLSIDRPLVGFLTDAGLLVDGADVPIGDWAAPALEAEIAVRLGANVAGDASCEVAREAVSGIAAAIELADVHPPPTDVREILSGNIFHRHFLVGAFDATRRDATGVTARVLRNGVEIAATEEPAAATGEIAEVVRLTAELLADCGEALHAGEVVITGAVVPPISVAAGERFRVELPPLGALEVALTGRATSRGAAPAS
ncbi:MAG: fumarylacetoacetate hydrolase family protein [Actinomycetota bacterium]|nr:fumarylacetoacetate hydrolase family protein [Actinomycetota bacterium]